jgi:hypothetical protein
MGISKRNFIYTVITVFWSQKFRRVNELVAIERIATSFLLSAYSIPSINRIYAKKTLTQKFVAKRLSVVSSACDALWSAGADGEPVYGCIHHRSFTGHTKQPTTLTSAPNDDNVTSTAQAIGFNFLYEKCDLYHFVVTPDGLLKLHTSSSGTGSNEPSNSITSTTNIPKLMPFWDDLALGSSGGYVRYSLVGSSPNRRAVIEWFVTIPKSTSTAAKYHFSGGVERKR